MELNCIKIVSREILRLFGSSSSGCRKLEEHKVICELIPHFDKIAIAGRWDMLYYRQSSRTLPGQ